MQTTSNAVAQLLNYLSDLPNGSVQDPGRVERLLFDAWDDLDGDDGGMQAYKVGGRAEDMRWEAPKLTFDIERHGATVRGSSRAEIQEWTINLDTGYRSFTTGRYRQLTPRSKPLNVVPPAEEVADVINGRKNDPRVKWFDDGRVQVKTGMIIPDEGVKQTTSERRRRFWKKLEPMIGPGWTRTLNILKPKQ